MSSIIKGTLDYTLLKRHYDCDDYVSYPGAVNIYTLTALNGIPFTVAASTFYVSGLMAYLNNPTVFNTLRGWTLFTHGQAAAPAWLAPLLAAAGVDWLNMIPPRPRTVPAFEAKDTLFYATQDCWIWFEGSTRVRHFIPANTHVRFHRRWIMIWVQSDSALTGELRVWIEG